MAKIGRNISAGKSSARSVQRISPMKPGLSGARNWATAQVRAASYTRKGFLRLVLSILFVFCLIFYCALLFGGYLPNARQVTQDFTKARLMSMGFVVKRVDVMGEGRLRESEVRATLGVSEGAFLFDLDTRSAQARIESLSWVDHAVVRRLWPDRVIVQIVERRPYALWQNKGHIKVVDRAGRPIDAADYTRFYDLPLFVGKDANKTAFKFYTHLQSFPEISGRTDAIIRVNANQWDLKMDAGAVWVKIPDGEITQTLAKLNALQKNYKILDREISKIDLRIKSRISLTARDPKRV